MKRKNLPETPFIEPKPIESQRLVDHGESATLNVISEDTSELRYTDFSLQTLINAGASDLLKPTQPLNRGALGEQDAFLQSAQASLHDVATNHVNNESNPESNPAA